MTIANPALARAAGFEDAHLRTDENTIPYSALRTQDSGLSTQDSGLSTQDSGLRTQHSGLSTQD
jgi:hypothetical protein